MPVTITVRAVEQNNWTRYPVSNTIHIESNQPSWTITSADTPMSAGEAEFYARLLKPDILYSITASDISGSLGSAVTEPIPVTVSAYGNLALTDYSIPELNTAVSGQQGVDVMYFTITNPNASGGPEYRVRGVTLTINESSNNYVESVMVSDSSGFSTGTAWDDSKTVFVDMFNPADPAIAAGSSRTYTIGINIRQNAEQGSFDLSVVDPLNVFVEKLNGARVYIEASGEDYPYNTGKIRVVERNTETTFYNYPNPFAAGQEETIIQCYLSRDSGVSLVIYDLISRRVKTIFEDEAQQGGVLHEYRWDGTNDSGRVVLNGVYYGVLTLDDGERYTTKIAVVK